MSGLVYKFFNAIGWSSWWDVAKYRNKRNSFQRVFAHFVRVEMDVQRVLPGSMFQNSWQFSLQGYGLDAPFGRLFVGSSDSQVRRSGAFFLSNAGEQQSFVS
mmetsp:Transcript_55315/g.101371  ORF Transcript_55315/g.101371 Transcript_55315/m.101371 type:complete len:102 (-) Transcript_55315:66-371(-)